MQKFLLAACAAVAVIGVFTVPASAAEAATCIGNCGTLGANGSVVAPPNGSTYQYVSTNGGVTGAGEIAGVANSTNGSEYLTDVFSGAAGDALKFNFNFITSDGGGQYADYAFSELLTSTGSHVAYLFTARTEPSGDTSPGAGLPANDATLTPSNSAIQAGTTWDPLGTNSSGKCFQTGCGNTGWIGSVYTLQQAGSYQIRFGASNLYDTGYDTGLAFSGITVAGNAVGPASSVPEPASWAMMIGGFGMIGAAMRRRRGATARFV